MIREITRQQIEFKIAQGDRFFLAETQAGELYDVRHLPNAVPMPLAQVGRLAREYFPNSGVELILYGEDENSPEVDEVAQELAKLGYGNLFVYRAGKRDWFEAGEYGKSVHEPPTPGMHVEFDGSSELEKTAKAFNHASGAE